MTPKILIIGSTGKLGVKLLDYTYKNNIKVNAITCFNNFTPNLPVEPIIRILGHIS